MPQEPKVEPAQKEPKAEPIQEPKVDKAERAESLKRNIRIMTLTVLLIRNSLNGRRNNRKQLMKPQDLQT